MASKFKWKMMMVMSVTHFTRNLGTGKAPPSPNTYTLSPAFQAFVGSSEATTCQVLKKIWEYIRANNLQNPKKKLEIICDEKLKSLLGDRDRMQSRGLISVVTNSLETNDQLPSLNKPNLPTKPEKEIMANKKHHIPETETSPPSKQTKEESTVKKMGKIELPVSKKKTPQPTDLVKKEQEKALVDKEIQISNKIANPPPSKETKVEDGVLELGIKAPSKLKEVGEVGNEEKKEKGVKKETSKGKKGEKIKKKPKSGWALAAYMLQKSDMKKDKEPLKSCTRENKEPMTAHKPKIYTLPPQLQDLVGLPEASCADVLRLIWQYIKLHNLQNPENRREIVCDEKLKAILGGRDTIKAYALFWAVLRIVRNIGRENSKK